MLLLPRCLSSVMVRLKPMFDGLRIFVQGKISQAFELVAQFRPGVFQRWLAFGGHDFERVRIQRRL